jgi:hypothetical protein
MRTGCVSVGLLLLSCMTHPTITCAEAWGGGGGPFVLQFAPGLEELNTHLKMVVGDSHGRILLIGGGGTVGISRNLRVGGLGAQGSSTIKGEGRVSELSIGYGGLLAEYAVSLSRIECFAGGMIGWGSLRLRIGSGDRNMDWDDFWNVFEEGEDVTADDFSGHLSSSFLCYQPYVGAQVKLNAWLHLRGSIGYFGATIREESWRESGITLRGAPSVELSNYSLQLSLVFGSFGS